MSSIQTPPRTARRLTQSYSIQRGRLAPASSEPSAPSAPSPPSTSSEPAPKCTGCAHDRAHDRADPIFTPKPDGTDFKTCDGCRARKKRFRNKHKATIKKESKKTNAKWNPVNCAKKSKALAEDRYEAALDLAEKLNMKKPMDFDESEASARKILFDNKAVFSTIKKNGDALYVALCTQKRKEVEPYQGAVRTALTTIATSSKTTPTELKEIGWDHVPLGDFDFNCEAQHVEKTLHRLLQHRFKNQKLWIRNGSGGGDMMCTNVSLCYGPLTGLVRDEKCNKVWA